ncbi:MAG TPA: 16S rRNA (uracil(1498)-N(3))-methyltransferase, partial [Ferruginibacter sp.]|nr:16S rRNA (uracil(1498)-N(3))-methyltransferase [Ferruginibacter sp.]
MASHIFFVPGIPANGAILDLPEESARHVVQVLRMQAGEALRLTDGRGNMAEAAIVSAGKKQCAVAIQS